MNTSIPTPKFDLILQSEFPLNALILATEALRIANQNSGRQMFDWRLVSLDGSDVKASNGMWLNVDIGVKELDHSDYIFVFEGNLPTQKNSPLLLNKLKEAHRSGLTVVGIDTGSFALAQAGLVGDAVVVHWEAAPTFNERFSRLQTSDHLFQIDGTILSCAGGIATLDLMLELIKRHHGEVLSLEVANALVHSPRVGWQTQRTQDHDLSESRSFSDRLVALMEGNLDFPLTSPELAGRLSVSVSTLDRHCRRHFKQSPMQLYLGIRLQAARNFLFYEDYTIKDVALIYGFSGPAVFSRTFKSYFGQTPSSFRKSIREKQSIARLPEVSRLYAMRDT